MIRDRIIVVLTDRNLSENLQLDPKLNYLGCSHKTIKAVRNDKKQHTIHSDDKSATANVDRIRKAKRNKPSNSQLPTIFPSEERCTRCEGNPYPKAKSPAKGFQVQ